MYAVHDFLLPLTDPSLQMKVSPRQLAIPPLLPLQGVLVACASAIHIGDIKVSASSTRIR